jgi:hypothetical protein
MCEILVDDIDIERMDTEAFDAIKAVAKKYGFGITGWIVKKEITNFMWATDEVGRACGGQVLPVVTVALTLLDKDNMKKHQIHEMGGGD